MVLKLYSKITYTFSDLSLKILDYFIDYIHAFDSLVSQFSVRARLSSMALLRVTHPFSANFICNTPSKLMLDYIPSFMVYLTVLL